MDGELRQFRLPTTNPFPKLDKRIASPPASSLPVRRVPSSTGVRPSLIIGRGVTQLPEMVADVIDASGGYAVENTRRERSGVRFGLEHDLVLVVCEA